MITGKVKINGLKINDNQKLTWGGVITKSK